jgi:predicted TIM-barrel fold metal-dependent hydrolase
MIIDCHVHIAALAPAHGKMSQRLLSSLPFRFMQWRLGFDGSKPEAETQLAERLAGLIDDAPKLDAAAVLAFDAVYDRQGNFDDAHTHLYVKNEYVLELSRRYPKMLFAASIHPYRADALAELGRCAAAGAVLVKWLPIAQGFNPADEKCFPFYEALAHYGIPLLSHTGGEQSLPNLDRSVASPALLEPALKRGVRVIMAHCGTRSAFVDADYLRAFMRLAREYEHCYGDTSALSIITRSYAYRHILADKTVRDKLVHGSDWPILPMPPVKLLGVKRAINLWRVKNWLKRDVLIKEQLGLDEAYWRRAATVLRLARPSPAQ